ncbi:YraN family protein [Actinomadura luteofluorescens]|uniref:YraN family protein n=1 Tax=Actinomadura luteofluorescens TaxID=46163 RepID=UPI003629F1CA
MTAHIDLGRRGEDAAARYLAGLGWTILDRNWRCPEGSWTSSPLTGAGTSCAR